MLKNINFKEQLPDGFQKMHASLTKKYNQALYKYMY